MNIRELATIDWNVLDSRRLPPAVRSLSRGGGRPATPDDEELAR
jgi:hypothetical protein